jgi:putative ABC transport system permease protein
MTGASWRIAVSEVPGSELTIEVSRSARLWYAVQECVRSAGASIKAHRLRSFLTMLGIIIGVSSVICVVALVQGLTSTISAQFEGLGSNMLTLRSETPLEDRMRGKRNRLRAADLDELRFRVEGISNITPIVFAQEFGGEARYGSKSAAAQVFGTNNSYQDVARWYPRSGRFITNSDVDSRRRVVVLGEQIRKDLELPTNPEGEYIQIGREWFKVIGVMEARGELFGQTQDNVIIMPYQTAVASSGLISDPDYWISFSVEDMDAIQTVRQTVSSLIRRVHGIRSGDKDDFTIEASDTIAKTFKQITGTITAVVAGIVGISLLVGGIGIMNIMLVSVTERTREIGIAKALGAPRHYILLQFLIEAMLLAVIGGLIGIALGFLLAWGISSMIPDFPPPSVSWLAVIGSTVFSMLIGVVFGILPASKAANLTPIDALRYE